MIETLTYSCQDAEQLAVANTKLQDIFDTLKSAMHQTVGVVIRPIIAKCAKPASQRYRSQLTLLKQNYSDLPMEQKRGRLKQSYLFRLRVSQRVELLCKTYNKKYGSASKQMKLHATPAQDHQTRPATATSASCTPQSDMSSPATSDTAVTFQHVLTSIPASNS